MTTEMKGSPWNVEGFLFMDKNSTPSLLWAELSPNLHHSSHLVLSVYPLTPLWAAAMDIIQGKDMCKMQAELWAEAVTVTVCPADFQDSFESSHK